MFYRLVKKSELFQWQVTYEGFTTEIDFREWSPIATVGAVIGVVSEYDNVIFRDVNIINRSQGCGGVEYLREEFGLFGDSAVDVDMVIGFNLYVFSAEGYSAFYENGPVATVRFGRHAVAVALITEAFACYFNCMDLVENFVFGYPELLGDDCRMDVITGDNIMNFFLKRGQLKGFKRHAEDDDVSAVGLFEPISKLVDNDVMAFPVGVGIEQLLLRKRELGDVLAPFIFVPEGGVGFLEDLNILRRIAD